VENTATSVRKETAAAYLRRPKAYRGTERRNKGQGSKSAKERIEHQREGALLCKGLMIRGQRRGRGLRDEIRTGRERALNGRWRYRWEKKTTKALRPLPHNVAPWGGSGARSRGRLPTRGGSDESGRGTAGSDVKCPVLRIQKGKNSRTGTFEKRGRGENLGIRTAGGGVTSLEEKISNCFDDEKIRMALKKGG